MRTILAVCVGMLVTGCEADAAMSNPPAEEPPRVSGGSSEARQEPLALSAAYLTGRWAPDISNCDDSVGATEYTADQKLVIDGELEPYRIEGGRITFNNPVSGDYSETWEQIRPIGRDVMRVRSENMNWRELRRCRGGATTEAARASVLASKSDAEPPQAVETCVGRWVYFPQSRQVGVAFSLEIKPDFKYEMIFADHGSSSGDYFQVGTLDTSLRLEDDTYGDTFELSGCESEAEIFFNEGERNFRLEHARGDLWAEAKRRGIALHSGE